MKVRIVPHKPPMCDNCTWWKVQVKSMLLRILFFRVYYWRTVGDYTDYNPALAVAKEILENEKEFGEETK